MRAMLEIRKIYFVHFLAGLSNIAAVTFTLYFLANGLNQAQIAGLFAIFMISLAILEIPTGGFADTYGHKTSIALGLLFQALAFVLFFLYPNYLGFLVGMISSALGLAFQSGAISSLVYEILQEEGLHESFQKVLGKAGGYFLFGSIFGSTIGSVIFKYNMGMPYFLAFVCFTAATIVMYFVKWEFTKKNQTAIFYLNTIRNGVFLTVKNKVLMATVVIGIALTLNRMVFNQNINQPYLLDIGVDVAYIGVIAAIAGGIQAIVSINAYKVSKAFGKTISLLIIVIIPAVTIGALSMIDTLIAIPVIYILFAGHAFRDPVMSHIAQEEVDPDKRSTMSSTVSFLVSICVGLLIPYWGRGIDLLGIPTVLLYLGAFTITVGGLGLLLYKWGSKD